MRQNIVHSLIASLIVSYVLASPAWSANWETDLEAARALALQENKLLLIHFWTPDCGPCKVVEKKVFPTPQVAQAIRDHYVPLKVNAYENTVLRDFFNVRQWPTDVIATIDGKALHTMVTPQDPRRYATALTNLAKTHRSSMPSMSVASQLPLGPSQERTHYQRTPWSNKVAAPDISENTARARRPGVDLQAAHPGGPLGGPMMPQMQQQAPAAAPSQIRGLQSPAPAAISNQFANRQAPTHTATPSLAQTEIRNPYAQQSPSGGMNAVASQPAPHRMTSQSPVSQPNRQFVTNQAASPQQLNGNQTAPTPQLGLDGRCPVTLVMQKKWVKGNAQWGAIHRGQTYLFAGPEEQQKFLANPDQYSPVLAGMDVVALASNGSVMQGRRGFGVLYDDDGPTGPRPNRIYLFDSAATRDRFESNPEAYVQPVMQALRANQLQTLVR